MASRIDVDPGKLLATLKNTVFKGANDDELLALVVTANEYRLNPLLKELYAFPSKGGGITPIVGIDGWLKIINRQPNFDGMTVDVSEDGESAKATIYLKDRSHPVEITEYLSECRRPSDPWKNMPKRMLRHKAIMQCARVAFGISAIRDEDEASDMAAPVMRNITPQEPGTTPPNPYDDLADESEAGPENKTPGAEDAPVPEEATAEPSEAPGVEPEDALL